MKIRKKALTLLEIMIVICLIAIIAGVVGYNMKGSLEEGKAHQTKMAIGKLKDILELELATNDKATLEAVVENPEKFLKHSGLIKDPNSFMKDGWGERFQVTKSRGQIHINSESLERYKNRKSRLMNTSTESSNEDEEY